MSGLYIVTAILAAYVLVAEIGLLAFRLILPPWAPRPADGERRFDLGRP